MYDSRIFCTIFDVKEFLNDNNIKPTEIIGIYRKPNSSCDQSYIFLYFEESKTARKHKENITIEYLRKLTNKYSNIGLNIYVEFTSIGIRVTGYWDPIDSNRANMRVFNAMYEYRAFDCITLENAIDMFKEEFENQLKEKENKDVKET